MVKIYENGIFISCEAENRIFKVLIEDRGKIVFTGDKVPDEYEGISSRVNLGGKCVVPAFADTHIHFESFSFFQSTFDVRRVKDLCRVKSTMDRLRALLTCCSRLQKADLNWLIDEGYFIKETKGVRGKE